MSTDTDKPLNGTREPFRRPVVWGRPPATVFRAGPLPQDGGRPPLPETPRIRVGPGILTGSMIPRTVPAQARAPAPAPAQTPVAVAAGLTPDLTVRPLPPAEPVVPAQLSPTPETVPAQPVVVAVEPAVTPVPPASARRKPARRVLLYAGIALAAVTVLALGGWIWTRAPGAVTPPAPAAPALEIVVSESPLTAVPVSELVTAPAAEVPEPGIAAAPAGPTAIVAASGRTPPALAARPASPAPEVVAPPPAVAVATAPRVEIVPAPVPGPAPTEAERPSTDPDAPIATRPQPIG